MPSEKPPVEPVRPVEPVDTDAVAWAYDTPLNAPRRGLRVPPEAEGFAADTELVVKGELPVDTGTISPMIHPRRDTPLSTPVPEEDGWQALGIGVLLMGTVTLLLAASLAFFAGLLLVL